MTPDEQEALDALIVMAFTHRSIFRDVRLEDAPELDPDDRRALDALGSDIVDRILAGEWKPRRRGKGLRRRSHLAGAMNRDDSHVELTDEARAEMERKIREIEEDEEKKP